MKPLALFLLLCLLSCREQEKIMIIEPEAKAVTTVKDTPEYLADSLTISGKKYKIIQGFPTSKNHLNLSILHKGDTVYRHNNFSGNGFEFKDFDGNGTMDIELSYVTNIGGIKEWVVFDTTSKTFKEIRSFNKFPSSGKLAGTRYFYSDHNAGCGGGIWNSELFYIDDFKAKAVSRISIIRCRDADYTHGVTIHKIDGINERIVEQMVEVPEKFSSDSDFFSTYWAENYKRFE